MTHCNQLVRASTAFCGALVLLACGQSASGGKGTETNRGDALGGVPMEVQTAVALGQTRLESSLKDAPTAKFQNRFVSRAGDGLVYCGEVNARNGFGGYNGYRHFIVGPNDPVVIDGEAQAFDLAWSGECSDPVFKLDQ